jgi:hypothetical protein
MPTQYENWRVLKAEVESAQERLDAIASAVASELSAGRVPSYKDLLLEEAARHRLREALRKFRLADTLDKSAAPQRRAAGR